MLKMLLVPFDWKVGQESLVRLLDSSAIYSRFSVQCISSADALLFLPIHMETLLCVSKTLVL